MGVCIPGAGLWRFLASAALAVIMTFANGLDAPRRAQAGPGDPSADVLEMNALPGETTQRVCNANGFIEVVFFNAMAQEVSRIESSTTCDPNAGNLNGGQTGSALDRVLQAVLPAAFNGGDLATDFGVPFSPFAPNAPRLNSLICEAKIAAEAALAEARANLSEKFEVMRQAAAESAQAIRAHVQAKGELEDTNKTLQDANAALENAEEDRKAKEEALKEAEENYDNTIIAIDNLGLQNSLNPANILLVRNELADAKNKVKAAETALEASKAAFEAASAANDTATRIAEAARASEAQAAQNRFEARKRAREAEQAVAAAQQAVADAEAALEKANAACGTTGATAFLPVERSSARTVLAARATPNTRPMLLAPAGLALSGDTSVRREKIAHSFNLASARASREAEGANLPGLLGDTRFNAWINGGVTFQSDDNAEFGQDGHTVIVSGGVSYLVKDNLNIGVAMRFGDTRTDGATGETEADTRSIGAFAQMALRDDFVLSAMLAYSWVDVDARFGQGAAATTGKTDADSLAGQLSLSRNIAAGRWTLSPNAGVSFVNIARDAFTASDGTFAAGSDSTQAALSAGIGASTRFEVERANGRTIALTPTFSLGGFANVGDFDPLVGATGLGVDSERFGLTASAGVAADLGQGASLGIGAGISGLTGDTTSVSISARFSKPL